MFTRSFRVALLALTMITLSTMLSASERDAAASQPSDVGRPEQVTLSPEASGDNVRLRTAGDGYLSPMVEADSPFTHLLVRWEASGTDHEMVHDTLKLEIRTSLDGDDWGPWVEVVENDDLWMPEDGEDVHWSQIIYGGEGARFWQVRSLESPTPEGDVAELHGIDVNTVDGRFGDQLPTYDRRAPSSLERTSGVPKPAVISRTGWGNPDGQGSRVPPAYRAVTHMIVHHTAESNSLNPGESSWSDRVRAIWSFHTFSRGWGDIGYNYLIDPNGIIYEGRSGGDNAVGFHDTGNYGSMGVSLIGSYASVNPPAPMQNSLVEILAWKASQRDIDPLGSSYYYGCDISAYCNAPGAVLYNISGHRDVSHTTCPGQAAYDLLPTIRQRVRSRIDNNGPITQPDNGDLTIDEREDTFARSDANWYSAACGHDGHTYYTFTTDNEAESTNSATWRPNIPADGNYRVYAYVPQGCGLASPPYATQQARYLIVHDGGTTTRTVDHNTAEEWVDLGVYPFKAGNSGAVELYDYPAEPYSQRKIMFFDTVRWVADNSSPSDPPPSDPPPSDPPPSDNASIELLNVQYDRNNVPRGELLKVTFTVRNNGTVPIGGQAPQAAQLPDGQYNLADSYVYDEGECFLGNDRDDYPAYPKEYGRFRVVLGPTDRSVTCSGETGGYPWRWGINGTLQPGETRDIVGYVRFRNQGNINLRAGVIREYVQYYAQDAAPLAMQVTQERASPVPVVYDDQTMQPLAHVYELGEVPPNFLWRTSNALSIVRGRYVGSFAWDGRMAHWEAGGPAGMSDRFIVEQTRVFQAPVTGEYTFRTTSDDGSWLWVDGQPVVLNHGLHGIEERTGSMHLEAGQHVLSFKYFEFSGGATAGYDVRAPGYGSFSVLRDSLSYARCFGSTCSASPTIVLGSDDQDGTGMAALRYSWDRTNWYDAPGGLVNMGRMEPGTHTIYYRGIDRAGNESSEQSFTITIDPAMQVNRMFVPAVRH
jgi:hypothetical protein